MSKATEYYEKRVNNINTINEWILKEGYEIHTNREGVLTCLGLYKPAPTKNDIPEFLKYLKRGAPAEINNYVQGMYDALNLCK